MKATFANKDDVLWPGLSVSTRVLVDTLKQVVVAPDDAVQRGPDGLYVFVVSDDNKVSMQPVTVSHSDEGQSVVEHGLTPGQKVVVAGQYRLQPGTVVQPGEASGSSTLAKGAEDTAPKAP
jgi:multidrug efflux system membrane fusion protein